MTGCFTIDGNWSKMNTFSFGKMAVQIHLLGIESICAEDKWILSTINATTSHGPNRVRCILKKKAKK